MQGILSSEDQGICVLCQANLQSSQSYSVTLQILVDSISVCYTAQRRKKDCVLSSFCLRSHQACFCSVKSRDALGSWFFLLGGGDVPTDEGFAPGVIKTLRLDWCQSCCNCLGIFSLPFQQLSWFLLTSRSGNSHSSRATLELGQFWVMDFLVTSPSFNPTSQSWPCVTSRHSSAMQSSAWLWSAVSREPLPVAPENWVGYSSKGKRFLLGLASGIELIDRQVCIQASFTSNITKLL